MKNKKENILDKFEDKDAGFKVPENYFADFKANMKKSLPKRDFSFLIEEKTFWQHIRPWVYMAAMFGGIWCMMYVFNSLSSQNPSINKSMAEAFQNERFVDDYVLTSDFNEYDLYQQMYEDQVSLDDTKSEETEETEQPENLKN